MPLTPEQKQRFARHLLLPEVGADGQLRLCEAKFSDVEELMPYANKIRGEYLSRAGMGLGRDPEPVPVPEQDPDPVRDPVPELVLDPVPDQDLEPDLDLPRELAVATAYLQGSLSAVESIKAALALPLAGNNP